MKKNQEPLPRKGDAKAIDIYAAVGVALTMWEAAEDALVGLFRGLCAVKEPALFETYILAPRGVRADMLRRALKHYKQFVADDEERKVLEILKRLEKYAQTRNEIAHGFCIDLEHSFQGEVRMAGYYLMPSVHEGVRLDRSTKDYRFAHTSQTMNEFATAVNGIRFEIEPIMIAVMQRVQAETAARAQLMTDGFMRQRERDANGGEKDDAK